MMHIKLTKSQNINLKKLQKVIKIFIAIYFFVGVTAFKTGIKEIFPIFSWSLFSTPPSMKKISFNILIHGNNEKLINPPIPFNSAPSSTVSGQKNIVAIKLIQKLGQAHTKNNKEKLVHLQTLFEKNHLKENVKYELISETYNPIKKLKTGQSTVKHLKFFLATHQHD